MLILEKMGEGKLVLHYLDKTGSFSYCTIFENPTASSLLEASEFLGCVLSPKTAALASTVAEVH